MSTTAMYRAGIIGLGFIGAGDAVSGDRLGQRVADLDGTHLEAFSRTPRIEVVAGSSRDQGRRDRFKQRTGLPGYVDYREMLDRERLDIVSVATYTPVHCELTCACFEHGVRAVWCEKPIANNLPDAERMIEAAANAGGLLAINHNRRFNPNYARLRDRIADGALGDLTSVYVRWGSGRLGNVGTHLIDAVRMLTASEIEAVSGTLDRAAKPDCRGRDFRDPGGWGMLRLAGGPMVLINAADHACGPGRIEIDGTEGRALTGGDDVTLQWWSGEEETWPSTRTEATSMDRCAAEIVRWLDDPTTEFSCPAEQSVRTLEAIVALHAADARHAAWTALPLTGPDRARIVNSG